jgi:hypothetical protein
MSAERCRVGVILNGLKQFYVRETEQKREGRWVVIPLFDTDLKQATAMSEAVATAFVKKLQALGVSGMWLEDCRDGRRIEVADESQQQFVEDTRVISRATLDDEYSPDARWYLVKPVNRPNGGPMWLLKCVVPGIPDPQLIYEKDPLSCLQRAQDLNFLQFGERAPAPQPQPVSQKPAAPMARLRPRRS